MQPIRGALLAFSLLVLGACSGSGTSAPSVSALDLIAAILPPPGQTDAALPDEIQIRFSVDVLPSSLERASLEVRTFDGVRSGRFEYANRVARWIPDQALDFGSDYEVVLGDGVQTESGIQLRGPVEWSFSTRNAVWSDAQQIRIPGVLRVYPRDLEVAPDGTMYALVSDQRAGADRYWVLRRAPGVDSEWVDMGPFNSGIWRQVDLCVDDAGDVSTMLYSSSQYAFFQSHEEGVWRAAIEVGSFRGDLLGLACSSSGHRTASFHISDTRSTLMNFVPGKGWLRSELEGPLSARPYISPKGDGYVPYCYYQSDALTAGSVCFDAFGTHFDCQKAVKMGRLERAQCVYDAKGDASMISVRFTSPQPTILQAHFSGGRWSSVGAGSNFGWLRSAYLASSSGGAFAHLLPLSRAQRGWFVQVFLPDSQVWTPVTFVDDKSFEGSMGPISWGSIAVDDVGRVIAATTLHGNGSSRRDRVRATRMHRGRITAQTAIDTTSEEVDAVKVALYRGRGLVLWGGTRGLFSRHER